MSGLTRSARGCIRAWEGLSGACDQLRPQRPQDGAGVNRRNRPIAVIRSRAMSTL
jgi:hypothetical protein